MPERTDRAGASAKSRAQRRVDRIRAFGEELEQLERDRVLSLTAEQRVVVAAHHASILDESARLFDVDISDAQRQMSLGMRIVSFLGAVALAAAVYFFFHRIWGALSTVTQVALLVAAPVAAVAGVEYAARRERTLYFASLLALLALACFVLDLNVLGVLFNITPSRSALVAWAAFALILAYGYGLRLILAAGIVSGIAWLASTAGVFTGIHWESFMERPETILLAGAAAFAVPLRLPHERHGDFPPIYRLVGALAVLVPVLTLSFWGEGSFLPWKDSAIEALYQSVGFALCAGLIWLGIHCGWRESVGAGAIFFVVFLFAKFFDWWWDWMPKYLFFLILGATAIGLLALLRWLRTAAAGRAA